MAIPPQKNRVLPKARRIMDKAVRSRTALSSREGCGFGNPYEVPLAIWLALVSNPRARLKKPISSKETERRNSFSLRMES